MERLLSVLLTMVFLLALSACDRTSPDPQETFAEGDEEVFSLYMQLCESVNNAGSVELELVLTAPATVDEQEGAGLEQALQEEINPRFSQAFWVHSLEVIHLNGDCDIFTRANSGGQVDALDGGEALGDAILFCYTDGVAYWRQGELRERRTMDPEEAAFLASYRRLPVVLQEEALGYSLDYFDDGSMRVFLSLSEETFSRVLEELVGTALTPGIYERFVYSLYADAHMVPQRLELRCHAPDIANLSDQNGAGLLLEVTWHSLNELEALLFDDLNPNTYVNLDITVPGGGD